ncbi:MAG: type II toxin-antitoxin system Phd/YefM family antitoxin [Clostridia bacterium]|nr:type II toxin-antitoxin system Phd/YefM family antitoxin [Clostridia bacterium]
MTLRANMLQSLVPISQFSKGQATKVFGRLRNEPQLIVLKNNTPEAVLLSPEEYMRLSEIEENYNLLMLAQERLANGNLRNAIPEDEVMAYLGISEEDIDAAEDVEIE